MQSSRPLASAGAALALAAAALWLWISWCRAPASSWNDLRLAPVLMAAQGVPVYSLPGEGALTTWLYGPFPLWAWSTGLLGNDAPSALLLATATNILLTIAALAGVAFAWPGVAAQRTERLLALALTAVLLPEATFRFLQADNVAIACGLLANLALVHSPTRARLWLAAVLTAAALASKQTVVGLAVGQFAWLWWARGPRDALLHAGRTTLGFAAIAGVAIWQFGAAELWHGGVIVPSRLPWADDVGARAREIVPWVALQWGAPGAVLFALRRKLAPDLRALGLPIACWLVTLPFGVAGRFTTGGGINHLHGLPLLLAPALLAILPIWRARAPRFAWAPAALAVALVLGKINSADHAPLRPATARLELAAQTLRAHPGELWLPWAPTVTWFAERRFDHTEDGIYVSFITGHPVSRAHARAHLPPRFSMMLLPAGGADWGVARKLAVEPSTTREIGPWTLLQWAPDGETR